MAKIIIAGKSFVVKSSISMEDLRLVSKYRPKSLRLFDEETKDEIFGIGIGADSISDCGISFSGVTNDNDKLATATFPIPNDVEDSRDYVMQVTSSALLQLNEIEKNIASTISSISSDIETVKNSITITV